MNFITPEDVRVQAMVHAQDDYKRHIENNVGMNPFSTQFTHAGIGDKPSLGKARSVAIGPGSNK